MIIPHTFIKLNKKILQKWFNTNIIDKKTTKNMDNQPIDQ